MKTVYSNSKEIFHVWAQQNQEEGRAGNVSFKGKELYSYRACIGLFVGNDKGETAVLLSNRKYSMTTTRHQNRAMPAVRHHIHFSVYGVFESHDFHIREYENRYAMALKRLYACKLDVEYNKDIADDIYAEACAYADFFGVPLDDTNFPKFDQEKLAKVEERSNRDAEQKEVKRVENQKRYKQTTQEAVRKFLAGEDTYLPWDWRNVVEDSEKESITAFAKNAWRQGEEKIYGIYFESTLLRIRGDLVETSQGASFPIEDAKRVWPYIKMCVDNQIAWQRNGQSISLGNYRLDAISVDGTVTAGCHVVQFAEILLIAEKLELVGKHLTAVE